MSQRSAWNQAAPIFNRRHEESPSLIALATGEIEEILGPVDGAAILEIGCGAGRFAVALAQRGAQVTGVDVSDAQIAAARERADRAGVGMRLLRVDAADLSPLADASFDAVVALFATPYIEQIDAWLAECARLLRPGGRLLFAQDHPIRACFWDEEMEEESILPARSYFDDTPLHWTYGGSDAAMTSYHRPLSLWITSLHETGFVLTALRELPLPDGWADDPNADEYTRDIAAYLPQVIVFDAKKLLT